MSNDTVIIDSISIHCANNWQGDPTLLARHISKQIQLQASSLQSKDKTSITLQGHFGGNHHSVNQQLSGQLVKQSTDKGVK